MPRAAQKSIAFVLIALLAIISSVGEGLHSIPGCGHGVLIGDRVLWLGIDLPQSQRWADDLARVERPQDEEIPVYDEDQCAICNALGRSCTPSDFVSSILVAPLARELPPVALGVAPSADRDSLHARAPPLA